MPRGVSDGARLLCSPTATHPVLLVSEVVVEEEVLPARVVSSEMVVFSGATSVTGFVPQLERNTGILMAHKSRMGAVFFIAKSFKKYVDTYYEK
ncbi:MAG: hypothetical protein WCK88_03760 [bacterium]